MADQDAPSVQDVLCDGNGECFRLAEQVATLTRELEQAKRERDGAAVEWAQIEQKRAGAMTHWMLLISLVVFCGCSAPEPQEPTPVTVTLTDSREETATPPDPKQYACNSTLFYAATLEVLIRAGAPQHRNWTPEETAQWTAWAKQEQSPCVRTRLLSWVNYYSAVRPQQPVIDEYWVQVRKLADAIDGGKGARVAPDTPTIRGGVVGPPAPTGEPNVDQAWALVAQVFPDESQLVGAIVIADLAGDIIGTVRAAEPTTIYLDSALVTLPPEVIGQTLAHEMRHVTQFVRGADTDREADTVGMLFKALIGQ